jgi:hypothetical protein
MGDPPVAIPALTFLADHINCGFMAANTVCLQDFFAMIGNPDLIRRQPGEKESNILNAVNRLPDIMFSCILIRQMTVNALFSSVGSCMGPGLELCLHYMTSTAEDRRFGFSEKLWRTEQEEKSYCKTYNY